MLPLKTRLYLQRSWYFYKQGHGTLSLFVHPHKGVPKRYTLFQWKSELCSLSEPAFRQRVLWKLRHLPKRKIYAHLIRAIYAYWDDGYPTRVCLFPYNKWQHLTGRWFAEIVSRL